MTPKVSENGLHHQHHQQQPQHSDKILQSPSIDRRDFDMSKVNCKYNLILFCSPGPLLLFPFPTVLCAVGRDDDDDDTQNEKVVIVVVV